jgi:ribokinase
MKLRIKLTLICSQALLAILISRNYDYMMKVAGLGQCSLDHLLTVDFYPDQDTKTEATEWTVSGGGPVATALVSLSRLGVECDFYGIIGDDDSGSRIRESIISEKVETGGLVIRNDSSSQTAFIVVEKETGKRTIFWKRPSSESLRAEELPDNFPGDVDLLLLDGLMLEASLYAAKKARERSIPVMLDAGSLRKGMLELVSVCDYVVSSEVFARELIKTDDDSFPEEALKLIKSLGPKTVTVTLGDRGSITSSGSEIFRTPAFGIKVVDTTGAGDVFHGGYIYGLLRGWDIRGVVRFASAFAALKCRRPGGRAGIPSLEEVETLLKKET